MDYRFEFPNGYELYDLFLLNRLYARKKPGRRFGIAAVRVLLAVIGLLLIAVCGMSLLGRSFLFPVGRTFAVVMLIYGIVILALAVFYFFFGARRSRQIILKTVGSITTTLSENGFLEKNSVAESFVEYSAVKDVYYWKKTWFLFLDDRHAEILALRCLKSGEAADLPAFLREKTGKEIRYISQKDKLN